MNTQRILITGANGFVGRHLCHHLKASGREVVACIRQRRQRRSVTPEEATHTAQIGDLRDASQWASLLPGVDTVIHLAARVHVMQDRSTDPLGEFRSVNVDGTSVLAEEAAKAGVRRFLYLSSIKVNGEATSTEPFHPEDQPGYLDPYGQSKWEAEQKVREIASNSTMEWAVVRPTLIYGPGVRGNFLTLLRCVDRGWPLPLASVRNRRSLVSVYNLVDLLHELIDHPAAHGQTFLVKDEEEVSTVDLIRRIALKLGRRPHLVAFPTSLLVRAGALIKQDKTFQRLLGSLVVNTEKTERLLGWHAPMSLDGALARTCRWYQTAAAAGEVMQ